MVEVVACVNTITDLFEQYGEQESAIEMISLSTSDGFSVHRFIRNQNNFEADTMAAASSTLYSVSNAVVKQILAKEFKSTLIEANEGNVYFVAFNLDEKDYVLAMSAGQTMNIASLRMCINRLAADIKKVGIQNIH